MTRPGELWVQGLSRLKLYRGLMLIERSLGEAIPAPYEDVKPKAK